MTETAITTLLETAPGIELLVVDDASPYEFVPERLSSFSEFQFHRQESNQGFAQAVNVGLRRALDEGKDAVLVNADVEFFEPNWLKRMLRAQGDVVGAMLIYANGLIQHAGIYYSILYRNYDHIYRFAPASLEAAQYPRICPVTGALQLIRNHVLERVGIYDEGFKMGFEDVDYSHRVFISGLTCVYEPTVRAIHHESVFRGRRKSKKLEEWERNSFELLHLKYAGHSFADYVPTLLMDDEN